jgi:glycosyltransferase involved in cell wall biosynthesis
MKEPRARPFFDSTGGDPNAARLLLVSDQFPPAQTAGALRWQKLARFAADRGWELDVITRDPRLLTARDDSRLADLPPGTRVYGFTTHEVLLGRLEDMAGRAYRELRAERARQVGSAESLRSPARAPTATRTIPADQIRWNVGSLRFWLRGYWATLDHWRQRVWAKDIEALGRRILENRHHAVISCGPWHLCNHEAARRLSRWARLPFVMDLRDPWSLERRIAEPIATPLWFRLARHYESRAVRDADLVIVNAESVQRAMATRYPKAANRIVTITNGYDEEPIPESTHGHRFTIAYAGGIYLDRDPRPLFQAARRVIEAHGLSSDDFAIHFVGNVNDYGGVPIASMAAEEGIGEYVRAEPLRPRHEALEVMAGATMLLSLPQDSPWAIPSKIFEYMQFDAWILVMAEDDAPSALLLRDTEADVVSATDVAGMAEVLRRRYLQFSRGERPTRLSRDRRFSRRYQAGRLMDGIAQLLSRNNGTQRIEGATCATPLSGAVAREAAQ